MIVDKAEIVIGIPTFKRPDSLSRLLESIQNIETPLGYEIRIVLADNENLKGKIKEICSQANSSCFPFNVIAFGVGDRGISYARNKLLSYAFESTQATYLVMVDDDEIVSTRWLRELINMQKSTNTDVVGGEKKPQFSRPPEPWMVTNDVYYYEPSAVEGKCQRLVSTDNLLITRDVYLRLGTPKFDDSFALTGGGDTEYLHRLKKMGASFAYSKTALSYEIIPEERMSLEWARNRAYRIGIGLARVNMIHETSIANKLYQYLKLTFIICASSILCFLYFLSVNRRIKYQLICIKQVGKVAGYRGKRVYPYR